MGLVLGLGFQDLGCLGVYVLGFGVLGLQALSGSGLSVVGFWFFRVLGAFWVQGM